MRPEDRDELVRPPFRRSHGCPDRERVAERDVAEDPPFPWVVGGRYRTCPDDRLTRGRHAFMQPAGMSLASAADSPESCGRRAGAVTISRMVRRPRKGEA